MARKRKKAARGGDGAPPVRAAAEARAGASGEVPAGPGLRLHLALVLSGAASLINEVAWTRIWALLYGSGHASTATVLSVFMLGLGLGGRLWRRLGGALGARGVRLYRRLEVLLAGAALAAPLLMHLLEDGVLAAARAAGPDSGAVLGVRLALAVLTILPPAVLMGATLPAVCEDLAEGAGAPAQAAGLYAANTAGAVLGAVLAGVLLLPTLGLRATGMVAAGLSLAAALLPRSPGDRAATPARAASAPAASAPDPAAPSPAPAPGGVLAVYAFVGFWGMALEVLFARLVLSTVGTSSHALATVLGAFLTGIAAGSALGARLVVVGAHPRRSLARRLGALGLLTALSASLVAHHNELYLALAPLDSGLLGARLATLLLAALFMLPAGLGLGALFPAAVASLMAEGCRDPGEAVGQAYFVNSVAGAAGAFATHQWIAPATGTMGGAAAAGLALLLAGAWLLRRNGGHLAPCVAMMAAGVGVAVALATPFRVVQAAYRYRSLYGLEATKAFAATPVREVLWYRDGPDASVAVTRSPKGTRSLRINGKTDAGDDSDMLIQVSVGHLPYLLREAGGTALMVGLGAGGSADAALHHPIERLEVAEISGTVAAAARAGFAGTFPRPFQDPRCRLRLTDGRLLVRSWPEAVPVIVSEPTNIFVQGVSNLFTREFFQACREHLTEDGVLVQWVQAYDLPVEALKMVVRTLAETFPHLQLYWFDDFLVVASRTPLRIDGRRVAAALARPGVVAQLGAAGARISAADLAQRLLGSDQALRDWAGAGPTLGDDRPQLEYLAADARFRNDHPSTEAIQELLVAAPGRDRVPTANLLLEAKDGARLFPSAHLRLVADWEVEPGLERMRVPDARGTPHAVVIPTFRHQGARGMVQVDAFPAAQVPSEGPHLYFHALARRAGVPPAPLWEARMEGHTATGQFFEGGGSEAPKAVLTWTCPPNARTYVVHAVGRGPGDHQPLLLEALTKMRCVHETQ